MFKISAHATPTEESIQFGKAKGAYAVVYINYAEIDGAYELAKYYIERDGWIIDDLEDEYIIIEPKEIDADDAHLEYINEAAEDGYSVVFFCYENDEDELD